MANKATEDKEEIWKIYPEYPFIEVSNLGRVRTKDRTVTRSNGRKQLIKGCILKQRLRPDGYMDVQFSVNGKKVHPKVHRLAAESFIPNPDDLPEVNHIDCNRANNIISNLEWCSKKYNRQYREKYGKALGSPVFAVNLETQKIFYFKSQREAAQQLNVNAGHVNSVLKGYYRKTGGYWFCYVNEKAIENVREKFGDELANKAKELMKKKYN